MYMSSRKQTIPRARRFFLYHHWYKMAPPQEGVALYMVSLLFYHCGQSGELASRQFSPTMHILSYHYPFL